MNLQNAVRLAAREALNHRLTIAVVDDPIANAEDETGPFGFCPADAVPILYRHGTIVATVEPLSGSDVRLTEIQDNGTAVVCDCCGNDYTDRDDSGGFLFGSYAYCPDCASSHLAKIRRYGEEHRIRARCPVGVPFRLWVLITLRGGDNLTRTVTVKDAAQL